MFVLPIPAIVFAIGYLYYSNHMSKKASDNIAHDAHFGGALFGLIFTLILIIGLGPEQLISNLIASLLQGPTWPTMPSF